MTRVMYVGHTAKLSGGEIALSRLLPALLSAVEPLVVLAEDGPIVDRLRRQGIDVQVLPLPERTRDLRKGRLANPFVALSQLRAVVAYAVRLRRLIRDERIDIVHTNTLKAGFYGCLAARLASVPSVWHLRDRLAPSYLPLPAVWAARLAIAVLPSRVICNSAATRETVAARWLWLFRQQPAVIASPIHDVLDMGKTYPAIGSIEKHPGFRVGMVGRLASWKGQHLAIEAFARATLPAPASMVLVGSAMFGEEDYEASLRRQVADLGLEDVVELRGFVDDVIGVLGEFDVLVHASTSPEPFGQVIVEGMATGVPVVATREGGPSEIVTDGLDGLLYEAGDIDALAALLSRLAHDPDLRDRLREGGLRRAQDFTSAKIAPLVVDVYTGLLPTLQVTS